MKKRGRKPKAAADRKDDPLRIPMTNDQKDAIRAAAEAAGLDMAAWARSILLEAAANRKTALQQ